MVGCRVSNVGISYQMSPVTSCQLNGNVGKFVNFSKEVEAHVLACQKISQALAVSQLSFITGLPLKI